MVARPIATPVTNPPTTEATVALLVPQLPPVIVGISVVVAPRQTLVVPDKPNDDSKGSTATTKAATDVPQVLVAVYLTVSIPAVMAVKRPALLTVAMAGNTVDQVPPVPVTLSVSSPPAQTVARPVMVPAKGALLTLIGKIANL
jgi:hypothetical protein